MDAVTQNIALFIDMENLGREEAPNVGLVVNRLKERGYRLIIKKAYADWGRFGNAKRSMLEHSIELTEMPSHPLRGKNGADIKLAIDALEAAIFRDYLQVFVVVSGDSDFTPLLSKLREYNKYVIVIARRESMSGLLKGYCDELIDYDSLQTSARLVRTGRGDRYDLLRSAVLALEGQNDQARASRVKSQMLVMDPTFSENEYGFQQFKQYLAAAERDHVIQLTPHRDGDQGITLVGGNGAAAHEAQPSPGVVATKAPQPQIRKSTDPSSFVQLVLRGCRTTVAGIPGPARTDIVGAVCRRLDPQFELSRYGGTKSQGFLSLLRATVKEGYFRVSNPTNNGHAEIELTSDGIAALEKLPLEDADVTEWVRQALVRMQVPMRWATFDRFVERVCELAQARASGTQTTWGEIRTIVAGELAQTVGPEKIATLTQILEATGKLNLLLPENSSNVLDATFTVDGSPWECLHTLLGVLQSRIRDEAHLDVTVERILGVLDAGPEEIKRFLSDDSD